MTFASVAQLSGRSTVRACGSGRRHAARYRGGRAGLSTFHAGPHADPERIGCLFRPAGPNPTGRALPHDVARGSPRSPPHVLPPVLWAMAHMFDRHPNLNRFVAGGRLYQRDGIWISFTAKTAFERGRARSSRSSTGSIRASASPTSSVNSRKRPHGPGRAHTVLLTGSSSCSCTCRRRRAGASSASPSLANAWRLLPRAFVDGDPFFASAFVTNLGSVGLDAAYHHLYEYGTIPIFCACSAPFTTRSSSTAAGRRSHESPR